MGRANPRRSKNAKYVDKARTREGSQGRKYKHRANNLRKARAAKTTPLATTTLATPSAATLATPATTTLATPAAGTLATPSSTTVDNDDTPVSPLVGHHMPVDVVGPSIDAVGPVQSTSEPKEGLHLNKNRSNHSPRPVRRTQRYASLQASKAMRGKPPVIHKEPIAAQAS